MAALIIFTALLVGSISVLVVRLSVSLIFWISKTPENKALVFKRYFPYYIIGLFTLCITLIVIAQNSLLATYYFCFIFITALLVWRYELRKPFKTIENNITPKTPQHPETP
ncbi:hypothetical protein [Winogradskyella vidalii]|uniref:hypothetical protein n=1 Tax=Winogradskyella vidalii TaxID=2615024 RepID=UPI0015C80E6C|nr:hypothetical protein [Winogradskyella vidalii]